MKNSYHLFIAQCLWKKHLNIDDHVIDATCGNGHDALFLAKLIPQGRLSLFDIQEKALNNTRKLLSDSLLPNEFPLINYYHSSHENLSPAIKEKPPALIVYNLGYLPGGDKSITTNAHSTIISLHNAISILPEKGALSIMCYPRHAAGKKEEEALNLFLQKLDIQFDIYTYRNYKDNRKPFLIWIQRN